MRFKVAKLAHWFLHISIAQSLLGISTTPEFSEIWIWLNPSGLKNVKNIHIFCLFQSSCDASIVQVMSNILCLGKPILFVVCALQPEIYSWDVLFVIYSTVYFWKFEERNALQVWGNSESVFLCMQNAETFCLHKSLHKNNNYLQSDPQALYNAWTTSDGCLIKFHPRKSLASTKSGTFMEFRHTRQCIFRMMYFPILIIARGHWPCQ